MEKQTHGELNQSKGEGSRIKLWESVSVRPTSDISSKLTPASSLDFLDEINQELVSQGFAQLTQAEQDMLASSRLDALEETQRIEFGDGPALVFTEALASSPLISRENLTDVVAALETAFYQVKDDTLDACPDTEAAEGLIAALDECDGDVERACSMATERLRRRWFVGESPWGDDDAACGTREVAFGSSLPAWEVVERLASVEYVLDEDCGLTAQFDRGVERIRHRAEQTRALWSQVRASVPRPTSRSMLDTLKSIGRSFDLYDPVLSAHVVPCDIDYQLALPVPDSLLGIDYVHEYLRRLSIENSLVVRIEPEALTSLLDSWMPDWRDLVVNLYEPVAYALLKSALMANAVEVICPDSSSRQEGIDSAASVLNARSNARFSRASILQAASDVADNLALDVDARSYLFDFARENGVYLAR